MQIVEATSLDLETRANVHDHEALRLWLRLLTCTNLVETEIRSRLRQDFDCTLPRFDLLAQLDRHPEVRCGRGGTRSDDPDDGAPDADHVIGGHGEILSLLRG